MNIDSKGVKLIEELPCDIKIYVRHIVVVQQQAHQEPPQHQNPH